mgnify:CR=1 FL=1
MGLENLKRPTSNLDTRRYYVDKERSPLSVKNSNLDPDTITTYPVNSDNSRLILRDTRFETGIDLSVGNPYLPPGASAIDPDFKPIVSGELARDYENRVYGFNGYKGSNKDDEIGGIFNSPTEKYSNVFRTINQPSINDIVDKGNIVTRGGYPTKKGLVDLVDSLQTVTPTKYFDGGNINIAGTNFNKRGVTVEGVPLTSAIVAGNMSLEFTRREVDVENLGPQELGRRNLRESKLTEFYKNQLNPRRGNSGFRGAEPYQIFDTNGETDAGLFGGQERQSNQRGLPLSSGQIDANRITKFILSRAGIRFLARQATLGAQSFVVKNVNGTKKKVLGIGNADTLTEGLAALTLRAGKNLIMGGNVLLNSTKVGISTNLGFGEQKYERKQLGILGSLFDESPLPVLSPISNSPKPVGNSFLPKEFKTNFLTLLTEPKDPESSGDKHTIQPIVIDEAGPPLPTVETAQSIKTTLDTNYGAPFYFKDLRDNKVIVLRAYIDSINENVKPNWNETRFIGRTEPVYNYSHGSRDIAFTLKIAAGTKKELQFIYQKLNKLTSLAYGHYQDDSNLNGKSRIKPPLTRMRYGDLYNGTKKPDEVFGGMLGFIDSITYTYPTNATWEIEEGKMVPKIIEAALTYRVIHDEVPDQNTQFYGYVG